MQSVQLALARQDVKERESRDHCGCRSSDSYSPRRHWCFIARREAWVRGRVQICDDACSSRGDLDWEFALHSCPGHSAGMDVAMAKQSHRRCDQLPVLHPDAAGIDVGASELFVAVGADRDPQPVRRFPTFTRDLHGLADWLEQCGVRSVAMESTSVYWIPIYQILEARGIEVCLVNAQHVKNVPGRKTDVSDCQWLQYLHSVGLLRASFRPPGMICAVRALWRHRGSLVQMAAEHIMHIQKALDQMNLQVHRVLTEITGLSGLRILDAILAGERDPLTLARFCHSRVKSSESTVAKSLEGDYRPEHIFALRQSLEAYRYYQQLVLETDQEIHRQMIELEAADRALAKMPKRTKRLPYQRQGHEPRVFDLRRELYRIFGVDLTNVPGISSMTAQTILCEVGNRN
jgi:transposase